MIVSGNGQRNLKWDRETDVVRHPLPRPMVLPDRKVEAFELRENMADIQWYLDECDHHETYHRVRGFAFKRGNDHYRYEKKLILQDQNGEAREFDMYPEERIDVAYTFPQQHFLFYTGFMCYVYDRALKPGSVYDVIIRLKNRFDDSDIRDIVTGRQICM